MIFGVFYSQFSKDRLTQLENHAKSVSVGISVYGTDFLRNIGESGYRVTYISDVTVDEKRPKSCDKAPGLYIYLAEPEETMWDIAKRYNTEIRRIEEDNPPSEADQRRVLLIPVL